MTAKNTIKTALFAVIGIAAIATCVFIFTADYDNVKTQIVPGYGERYVTTLADSPVQSSMEQGGLMPEISFDFPAEVRLGLVNHLKLTYHILMSVLTKKMAS